LQPKQIKNDTPKQPRCFGQLLEAEAVHANNHLWAMNAIGSTPENLEGAISGEDREYESMYPEMIETAKAEKIKDAEMSFYLANEVEKIYSQLFNKLLFTQGT
jgi:rubrerythrin